MNKKPILLAFVLLAISCATAWGQKNVLNSLLWKIEGKGIKNPSYLFGTIHGICAEQFQFPAKVLASVNQTDKLYVETNMGDTATTKKIPALLVRKDNKELKDFFSAQDFSKLDSFMKANFKISASVFGKYIPLALTSTFIKKSYSCANVVGVDMEVIKLFKERKKDIDGLESVETQFQVFEKVPDEAEARAIMRQISDFPKNVVEENNQLITLYKKEDIAGLYKRVISNPDLAPYQKDFLDERNKNWVGVIAKNIKEQSTFFAVGAAHLSGKNGVINLLKKAGYIVTPVLN